MTSSVPRISQAYSQTAQDAKTAINDKIGQMLGFDAKTLSFYDKTGQHDIDGALARDYTVMQGLFNSFSWNGTAYEHTDPLSVSF